MSDKDQQNQLSPRARRILEGQLYTLRERLQPRLAEVLARAGDRLLEHAKKARNHTEQEHYLASVAALKRQANVLPDRLFKQLPARIDNFGRPASKAAAPAPRSDLALVAKDSQDERLLLNDLAARSDARATMVLFELGHRYAVLAARPALTSAQQPFSPAVLCDSLHQVISQLGLPNEHQNEIYRAFDRIVLQQSSALYEALNQHLKDNGILPDLRSFAPKRQGAKKAPGQAPDTASSDPQTPSADQAGGAPTPAAAQPGKPPAPASARADGVPREPAMAQRNAGGSDSEVIFSALSSLLQRQRQRQPVAPPNHVRQPAKPANIDKVLTKMQHQAASSRLGKGPTRPPSMRDLRRELVAQLRRANPTGAAPDFDPGQQNALDLVTMVFDQLTEEVQSTSGIRLLSELQAPLLRVAMDDPAFFTNQQHPARNWLDKVAEASAHWGADQGEEDGDPALIQHIHGMNRTINREFDGDTSVFDGMAEDLQKKMDHAKRRTEVAERRQVEAARGREKLALARKQADELISGYLGKATVPNLVRTLLTHAWADVLALSLLRNGRDSEDCQRNLRIADVLCRGHLAPDSQAADALRAEIRRSLAQVGVQAEQASRLADEVTNKPAAHASDASAGREKLSQSLQSRTRIGDHEIDEIAPALPQPDTSDHAEAVAWIKTLAFGTWFQFEDPELGKPVARKLAWYSTQTGRCLFVNRRGVRTHDTTIDHLAQSMLAGNARVDDKRKGSFLDRALKRILTGLQNMVTSAPLKAQPA